jgi:hypothetical protein
VARTERLERANGQVVRHAHALSDFGHAPDAPGVRMQEQEDLEHFEARDEVAQQRTCFIAQLVIHRGWR